jgi:Fur family ferric uptake transcriptional regulator
MQIQNQQVISTSAVYDLLDKYGLKKTQARVAVLKHFIKEKKALSHSEVEDFLSSEFDRVTLYRILKAFEKVGLIHHVPSEGANRYAITHLSEKDDHTHFHFFCEMCKKSFCLPQVTLNNLNFPKNLIIKEISLNVSGVCKDCQ